MVITYPANHKPRYGNFEIEGFLDETLREGAERCLFTVDEDEKYELINKLIEAGIRDIIVGSGPKDPQLIRRCLDEKFNNPNAPRDTKFNFILLLNSWEPIYEQFKLFPRNYLEDICISFGMVEYGEKELLLEQVFDKFKALGVNSYRVSLINNFSKGVDETKYEQISNQIKRCLNLGINTVRINDSLGVLYPETMRILAANLVHDFPQVTFCLHAHNDRGLGLQNALESIYEGFDVIEGAIAGYGNRSGLPAIEVIEQIFKEKNIKIKNLNLKTEKLNEAASIADKVFMTVPNIYRPFSGLVVNKENLGVLNIPDYLGVERQTDYFLNNVGLHINTVKKTLEGAGFSQELIQNEAFIQKMLELVEEKMNRIYQYKRGEFNEINERIVEFYTTDVMSAIDIQNIAKDFSFEGVLK